MTNYWVIIAATAKLPEATIRGIDVYYRMIQAGRWGFGERTPNAKHVQKGDRVVFYVASGSGESSHCFVGTARVSTGTHISRRQRKTLVEDIDIGNGGWPLTVELDSIQVWVDPIKIRPLISNLTMVKRPDRWGSYLQGGVRKIATEDFTLITGGKKGRPALSTREVAKIRPRVHRRKGAPSGGATSAEACGVIADGRLYAYHEFGKEKDFEQAVVRNSSIIFGPNCFYFDVKKRIGSKSGVSSIPDGFLLDLSDRANPKIHIVENELSSHDLHKHIVAQIIGFLDSLTDKSRRKIRDTIFSLLDADPERLDRVKEIIQEQNLHKVVDKASLSEISLVVMIDEEVPLLKRTKKRLEQLVQEIRIIVFESYVESRKKNGNMIHCFHTI